MAKLIVLVMCVVWAQLQPASAQPLNWDTAPRMMLERQYAGPLRDTLVQRWRDPSDGSICYIYLPISAAHSTKTETGFVQYGPNSIGSISCLPPARNQGEPARK